MARAWMDKSLRESAYRCLGAGQDREESILPCRYRKPDHGKPIKRPRRMLVPRAPKPVVVWLPAC